MNPALKTLPADAGAADILQLRQQLARRDHALYAAEAIIQELREALRLERIKRFGKQSEKLSDLQLELLSGEPGLSSEEIAGEVERGPLPEAPAEEAESTSSAAKQQKARRNHPGRNELPSHLKRVEKIITCAPEQCTLWSVWQREQGHRLRAD